MAKSIGLKQLALKKYDTIVGLAEDFAAAFGSCIESAFVAVFTGESGSGKSNMVTRLIENLLLAMPTWKCEWVDFEEGHAMTVQTMMIDRHKMLEKIGNRIVITEHLTYDELVKRISKKQSAKVWVINSIQASHFTEKQCAELRERFVLGKKKKIIIWISWAEGKNPKGAIAKATEFYADIKVFVEGFIAFSRTRYGGGVPYVIWEGDERHGAMAYWKREYWKITGKPKPRKERKTKDKAVATETPGEEAVTHMQILPPMTEQEILLQTLRSQTAEAV
jgi:electron transfer flavoprotein alpha subunit